MQEDEQRMQELRGPSVSHDWMWALNPAHGAHVTTRDFLTALRLRIGFHFIDDPMVCPRCGKAILGRSCSHAFCCAPAESTKGHYRVRDSLLQFVSLADASADTEPPNLIPSAPHLRPADIFTAAALPGCQAALDVGIMAPGASGAGDDCCEAMYQRKLRDYGPYLQELASDGIRYIPLAFLSHGRTHPEAMAVFTSVAQRAARRKGLGDHQLLLRHALSGVGVQIMRRASAMVRSCLPQASDEVAQLFGDDASDVSSESWTSLSDCDLSMEIPELECDEDPVEAAPTVPASSAQGSSVASLASEVRILIEDESSREPLRCSEIVTSTAGASDVDVDDLGAMTADTD